MDGRTVELGFPIDLNLARYSADVLLQTTGPATCEGPGAVDPVVLLSPPLLKKGRVLLTLLTSDVSQRIARLCGRCCGSVRQRMQGRWMG